MSKATFTEPNGFCRWLSFLFAQKERMKEMRPAIFALRVPKTALKKAVTTPQLVAAFLSTALANIEGG
jgi:hypothetical protein